MARAGGDAGTRRHGDLVHQLDENAGLMGTQVPDFFPRWHVGCATGDTGRVTPQFSQRDPLGHFVPGPAFGVRALLVLFQEIWL